MATSFPGAIQQFTQMQDITASDARSVSQYQQAMQQGDIATALSALSSIVDYDKKIINADYLNTINDTLNALQLFFEERYNPAYIVSMTQPAAQAVGDYWFDMSNN